MSIKTTLVAGQPNSIMPRDPPYYHTQINTALIDMCRKIPRPLFIFYNKISDHSIVHNYNDYDSNHRSHKSIIVKL